jgi:hypothetical protein
MHYLSSRHAANHEQQQQQQQQQQHKQVLMLPGSWPPLMRTTIEALCTT